MNETPHPATRPDPGPASRVRPRLAEFDRDAAGPVTLVFATYAFREVVRRWIGHARAAGCLDYRIVCMDGELLEHLRDAHAETRAVSYYRLFPDTEPVDIDAIASNRERLQILTPLRTRLFRELADRGIDFIHSDADAFWLRDPRPWLDRHGEYDLLGSQGSHIPRAHFDRHGFVLCAGFFLCRANERTRRLWAAVDARRDDYPSDQRRLNAVLLADPAGRWRIRAPRLAFSTYWRPHGAFRRGQNRGRVSRWFRLPLGARAGERVWRWIGHAPHRRRLKRLLGACRMLCMVTSEHVIDGRFSGGLRVGVIPMSMIPRVLIAGDEPRLAARLHVRHTVHNKSVIEGQRRRAPPPPLPVRWWHAAARRRFE